MKTLKLASLLVLAILTQACSTYTTDRYAISANNVVALKQYRGSGFNVGRFTASQPGRNTLSCRAVGPIPTPDGETFEQYIRNALISEMQIAEVYSKGADITLSGNLNHIEPDSLNGTWTLSLTLDSSNGNSITVREVFNFRTSFIGETACNQTAQALMPAVQNVIALVLRHPDFISLVQ